MNSSLIYIIAVIIFLALIFAKTKTNKKQAQKRPYKNFKYFEKENSRKKAFQDHVFELGGFGVTQAPTRSEESINATPVFNDERINNDPRGIFGEAAMAALVARVCDNDKRRYVLMRNLYIPTKNGTTEIDALLLHQSGIYVLESKNIAGEISGELHDERWTQHMNKHLEHTFHNPIKQNIGHILPLQKHLNLRREQSHFISIIVFSDRCLLRKVPADNRFWNIMHCCELQKTLQKTIANRKTIYTTNQLEDFYWKLEPCMHVSERTKADHKAYVQSKVRN